jgi:hypothetical protein
MTMDVWGWLTASGGAGAVVGLVLVIAGSRRLRRAKNVDRIVLPARIVSHAWVGPGVMYILEYAGPTGEALRASVFSAIRRGLGATPTFAGLVYVNRADPTDVVVRAGGRKGVGLWLLIPGIALLVVGVVLVIVSRFGSAVSSSFPA